MWCGDYEKENPMNRSWKTTLAGLSAIIVAVLSAINLLIDGNPSTNPDWGVTVSAVIAGIGLIFGKDYNVTGGTK